MRLASRGFTMILLYIYMYCSDQTCFFNERTKFWSLGLGQSSQVIGLAHLGLGEKNNTHTHKTKFSSATERSKHGKTNTRDMIPKA